MNLRDYFRKKKKLPPIVIASKEPTILLLEYKPKPQIWKDVFISRQWQQYMKAKTSDLDFFKQMKLASGFATTKRCSLRRNIELFPYYKRGTKGVILEDSCVSLFPLETQKLVLKAREEHNVIMVLFEHTIMTIPLADLRILKR